jgi:uncharacterized protein
LPLSEPGPTESLFRRFRIVARVDESDVITSYYLAPVDGGSLPSFRAGQYLTLRIADTDNTLLRTYTISSSPGESLTYRISVKREPAPPDQPHVAPGRCSNWLFEHGSVGAELDIAAPRGDFVLDEASSRPVLLLSGGVGLTPMVSMLHALAPSGRTVHFIHACEHGGTHALRSEVLRVAAQYSAVSVHFVYRAPQARDRDERMFHTEGLVSRELLRSMLPLDDYDAYLCGPPGFMRAVYDALHSLGVRKERIRYEFFGPSSLLETEQASTPLPAAAGAVAQPPSHGGVPVAFVRAQVSGVWRASHGSLLDFAETLGLSPDFSCRAGICGTCACGLLSGQVDYSEEPLDPPGDGQILLCIARPRGDVRIDL